MFLIEIFIFLLTAYFLKHWLHTRKWDHFPGFSSYSSLPLIGHSYRLGGDKPLEYVLINMLQQCQIISNAKFRYLSCARNMAQFLEWILEHFLL